MSKPRATADKRNRDRIRLTIRSPILRKIKLRAEEGGVLSLLNDLQLSEVADMATNAVLDNERLSISIKRSR